MQETERQRIERLLRDQLAGFRQAEVAESPFHALLGGRAGPMLAGLTARVARFGRWRPDFGALLPNLLSKPRPVERIETAMAVLRARIWPRLGKAGGRHAAEPPAAEAHRAERAFDDLYAAVLSDRPRAAFEGRADETPAPRRRPARPSKHDLPNGSGGGARLAAMKDVPARDWGPPPKIQFPRPDRKKGRRSDFVVAALGIVLGLTCALFPWYIFFNQEQFGVQAISLGGRGHNAGRIMVDPKSGEDMTEVARQDISRNLDLFSTGSVPGKPETPDQAPGLDQQPFPAGAAEFRLVHVANGRAMIEDDAGLWIAQQGSDLPDQTRVKSIEQRKGRWVVVTSADRVIEISK